MKKFSLLLISTYNVGLHIWKEQGLYSREIAYYQKLEKYLSRFGILTYDNKNEKQENATYVYYYNHFGLHPFLYSILAFYLHRKAIRNFDVIKTNQFAGAWLALFIKIFHKKKIFILRGGHAWDYESGSKLTRWIANLVMDICIRYADLIFFVSNEDKEKYLNRISKKNLNKIKILPNAVDTNLFSPKTKPNNDKIKIVMVGRLVQMKNFQSVLSALSNMDSSIKNRIIVDIIGDGEYISELKKAGEGLPITFHGSLPNDKTAEFLSNSDIFVLPQFYGSGMSKVILEAMASGNIVIASDLPAHRNTIDEGINGYISGVESSSIQEKLEYVIKNYHTEEIIKIKEMAIKKVQDNFSMDSVVKKEYDYICEIYEK